MARSNTEAHKRQHLRRRLRPTPPAAATCLLLLQIATQPGPSAASSRQVGAAGPAARSHFAHRSSNVSLTCLCAAAMPADRWRAVKIASALQAPPPPPAVAGGGQSWRPQTCSAHRRRPRAAIDLVRVARVISIPCATRRARRVVCSAAPLCSCLAAAVHGSHPAAESSSTPISSNMSDCLPSKPSLIVPQIPLKTPRLLR